MPCAFAFFCLLNERFLFHTLPLKECFRNEAISIGRNRYATRKTFGYNIGTIDVQKYDWVMEIP